MFIEHLERKFILWGILLIFFILSVLPVFALPKDLSSPEQGVLCNLDEQICYDKFGPSIAFTEMFLGENAGKVLLDRLRNIPAEEIFGYRVDLSPSIYFLKMEEICFSNGEADRELTEILFGKDAGDRINSKITPEKESLWKWQETIYYNQDKGVPGDPENYTLRFLPDGSIRIKADCNNAGGTFTVRGNRLEIVITHSTLAWCLSQSLYDKFLKDLTEVKAFDIDGSYLYLDLGDNSAVIKFKR